MPVPDLWPIRKAIQVLNEALQADPEGINVLIQQYVVVNETLADHPSIQVEAVVGATSWFKLRPLGLINGLFGADEDGYGFIAAQTGDDGQITRFIEMPAGERGEASR